MTTRGVAREAIVRDDEDRRVFLHLFQSVVDDFTWRPLAFCLMTNHYHVVVDATQLLLSAGMHRLNGRYAEHFNAKYARSGHLFGDRFAAWLIESEEHLYAACAYVLENPVRAGLTERVADWSWSHSVFTHEVG